MWRVYSGEVLLFCCSVVLGGPAATRRGVVAGLDSSLGWSVGASQSSSQPPCVGSHSAESGPAKKHRTSKLAIASVVNDCVIAGADLLSSAT